VSRRRSPARFHSLSHGSTLENCRVACKRGPAFYLAIGPSSLTSATGFFLRVVTDQPDFFVFFLPPHPIAALQPALTWLAFRLMQALSC